LIYVLYSVQNTVYDLCLLTFDNICRRADHLLLLTLYTTLRLESNVYGIESCYTDETEMIMAFRNCIAESDCSSVQFTSVAVLFASVHGTEFSQAIYM